jgi:hypothetical protein
VDHAAAVERRRHERLHRVARHLQQTATYRPCFGVRYMDHASWEALAIIYTALYEVS